MALLQFKNKGIIEAGCDEAGRGCLAGPVYAAAVILPEDYHHPLLNDSKQLREKDREVLRGEIIKNSVCWSVAAMSNEEIDRINILNASIASMQLALDNLMEQPEHILVDGNRFKEWNGVPFSCEIKGDGRFASIAAASILAKTFRDDHMRSLHLDYPVYRWDSNKGYPTAAHREAIMEHGPTVWHRNSFTLIPEKQIALF